MKTFFKSLALALVIGAASVNSSEAVAGDKHKAHAFASYQTAIYPSSVAPVVNVTIDKEGGSSVVVRIKTKNGDILSERLVGRGKDKVAMKFRVDELPDGIYTVEVTNGRDVTTKQIKIATQPQESPRTVAML